MASNETKYLFVKTLSLLLSGALFLLFAVVFASARLYGGSDMRTILITNHYGENMIELIFLIALGVICIAIGVKEFTETEESVRRDQ